MKNPTEEAYAELRSAYDFFNAELFAGRLPACLITYHRNRRTYGYFCGDRWDGSGERLADETALNPQHFTARGTTDVLSTLVHEMVPLEQHHFGKASRTGYHNKQWAEWMGPRWPGALAQRATWRQTGRSANDPLHRRRRRV